MPYSGSTRRPGYTGDEHSDNLAPAVTARDFLHAEDLIHEASVVRPALWQTVGTQAFHPEASNPDGAVRSPRLGASAVAGGSGRSNAVINSSSAADSDRRPPVPARRW